MRAADDDPALLADVPANSALGFRTFSLDNGPITKVTITPALAGGKWDDCIDRRRL